MALGKSPNNSPTPGISPTPSSTSCTPSKILSAFFLMLAHARPNQPLGLAVSFDFGGSDAIAY